MRLEGTDLLRSYTTHRITRKPNAEASALVKVVASDRRFSPRSTIPGSLSFLSISPHLLLTEIVPVHAINITALL